MTRRFRQVRNANGKRARKRAPKQRPLLPVLRALGLHSLLSRGLLFVVLSFTSGLCQAGLLVSISEIAVATVQGKKSVHVLGHSFTPGTGIALSFGLIAVFFVTNLTSSFMGCRLSVRALTAARTRVIDGFFGSSWPVQSSERLGHLQQLLVMNSSASGALIQSIAGAAQSLLTVIALLAVATLVNPLAAVAVVSVGICLSLLLRPLNKRTRAANRTLSRSTRAMATQVTEYTRLARDFRLAGVQSRATEKVHDMVGKAASIYLKVMRYAVSTPIIYQSAALVFVVAALALLVHAGHSNLASLGAVLLLILRSISYGSSLQNSIQGIRGQQGMLEDLLVDLEKFDASQVETVGRLPDTFEIVFSSVNYSYDGITLAVSDLNFSIPEGSIVGILGPSGSGKTTISQILLGLRKPTSGSAAVGGVEASEVQKGDGQSPIALVPQEPVLLQGSITENVKFFRDFDDEDVLAASRIARLDQDVERMPAGYQTLVGEGGGALSGGQKQRLAIARALIGSPKLIVLDEPTSALDGRTERLVRQTLSQLRGQVTVIIISHRLDTTAECDYLLILDKGHVADFGARDEVVQAQAFQTIVLSRSMGDGKALPWVPSGSATVESSSP